MDPQFVDWARRNYHLSPCSPAIDARDPASAYALEPAPDGCRVNLGFDGDAPDAATSGPDDPDGDGPHGACDNCPSISDPDQANANGDSLGGDSADVTYDLVRSDSPAAFTASRAVCAAEDISSTTAEDATSPDPGMVFHCLARAQNRCGLGPAGYESAGVEKSARVCP